MKIAVRTDMPEVQKQLIRAAIFNFAMLEELRISGHDAMRSFELLAAHMVPGMPPPPPASAEGEPSTGEIPGNVETYARAMFPGVDITIEWTAEDRAGDLRLH